MHKGVGGVKGGGERVRTRACVCVCVSKYALRTCKQQSALEEPAVKQKSVAPFRELKSGIYRVGFFIKRCFLGSLGNALVDKY